MSNLEKGKAVTAVEEVISDVEVELSENELHNENMTEMLEYENFGSIP